MSNIENFSGTEIQAYQERELQQALTYLSLNSPFYKRLFQQHQINISEIKSLKDLQKIPVTTKDDLQQYNWDFLCVDRKKIAEYCTTSGTMGTPVVIGLTENDLQRLAYNECQSFLTADCTSDDTFQLMLTLDRQFMAGIAYYLGARKLNAGVVRTGPGNIAMQLDTIRNIKSTVLIAVPSFILSLISYAKETGFDLNQTSVKKIICIGENIRNSDFSLNALGEQLIKSWKVELFSTYASTEKQTAFTECKYGKGGHHRPDLLHFEILDENNKSLPPGEYGELTITTLGVEGMPLLRYKTGDICTYNTEPCECGRSSARISPIEGRKQQLIKYNGTTLYPQAIFNVLDKIEEVNSYVVNVSKNEIGTDDIQIEIALKDSTLSADNKIKQALQSALRIVPRIQYVSLTEVQKKQMQEGKRKASKLIDNR